ncbi:ATPase central domain-containing protein, partial [mine drainage metagenome]
VLAQLISSGPFRRFSFPEDTLEKLEKLKPKVGNFAHVVEHVMDAISLSFRYHKPIKITPILVVGEPGIGKSYFTRQLAGSLGVPLRRVPMDNLQVGASLAGSSYIYTNSEPGAVFKVLTQEDHISPIIILDEIDKTGDNFAYGDPLSPLHNLLEPESAKLFEDASCNLRINASHVIWIATANYIDKIPATIRSRFDIFEIRSCGDEER